MTRVVRVSWPEGVLLFTGVTRCCYRWGAVHTSTLCLLFTGVTRSCYRWRVLPKGLRPFGIPGSASGWDCGDGWARMTSNTSL